MGDTLFNLGFSTEKGWHTPLDGGDRYVYIIGSHIVEQFFVVSNYDYFRIYSDRRIYI